MSDPKTKIPTTYREMRDLLLDRLVTRPIGLDLEKELLFRGLYHGINTTPSTKCDILIFRKIAKNKAEHNYVRAIALLIEGSMLFNAQVNQAIAKTLQAHTMLKSLTPQELNDEAWIFHIGHGTTFDSAPLKSCLSKDFGWLKISHNTTQSYQGVPESKAEECIHPVTLQAKDMIKFNPRSRLCRSQQLSLKNHCIWMMRCAMGLQ
ncbi:UNVERIFIED_CONTAM: hypothetical protein HDU68_005483, partial [Siphonaria sp. JEL0065]